MIFQKSKLYQRDLFTFSKKFSLKDIFDITELCRKEIKRDVNKPVTKWKSYSFENSQGFLVSLRKNYHKLASYYSTFVKSIDFSQIGRVLHYCIKNQNYKNIDIFLNTSNHRYYLSVKMICIRYGDKKLQMYIKLKNNQKNITTKK